MADTTRLTIPEEAFQAAVNISGTMRKLEAAAPLIVAAELERLAKGRSMIAPEELQDRAAELRGGAS